MSALKENKKMQPSEIYISFKTSLKLFQVPFSELTDEQRKVVRNDVQKEYELQQKILQTAEVAHVKVDDRTLNQAINCIRNRYQDSESFDNDLHRNGLTDKSFKEALTEELKAELVLAHVAKNAPPVTDEEIKEYYSIHKEKFTTQEQRFARHILITINPAFEENSPENARKRLENILQQLEKDPSRFPELAANSSECPSALKKGELGRVGRGKLFPQLEQVLFQMAEGEVSKIVVTEMGLHLLSCEKIWPAKEISLQEARKSIQTVLEKKQRLSHQKKWLQNLMNKPISEKN